MSEEKKKADKWEKSNWFLFYNSDYKTKYHIFESSKKLIEMAFNMVKLGSRIKNFQSEILL